MDNSDDNSPNQLTNILAMSESQLKEALAGMGEKSYRANQIIEWVFQKNAQSFEEMTNLSKDLRSRLADRFSVFESKIIAKQVSSDNTEKLLLQWKDGQTTECVLIPSDDRRTVCISTQVGCPVGCAFCASGIDGLTRNLTAEQIVEQVLRARQLCLPHKTITNVVVMGLGEPLANYQNTLAALRTINDPKKLNIGSRKITVSTVGLIPQMKQLAAENMQFTLALSLHAPTDELRRQLIPWAKSSTIADLVETCNYYFQQTGREITIEYVLLKNVNDSPVLANKLADLCHKMRCNVNLIRYNPVESLPYDRPEAETAQQFLETLRKRGVNVHLRKSRGMDIDGACGQLRRRMAD